MTEPALASDGRVIGARAHRTRRRLLEATAKLLEERGALGLRVVDITREVGTSPATFYQYFPDVEEAILVLADEATDDIETLAAVHPQTPWNEADGVVHVQEFVSAFMEYWDRHRVILRVRDLRAEEGDERFWAARRKGYGAIIPELTAKIEKAQTAGTRVQGAQLLRRRRPPRWRCSSDCSPTARCSAGAVSPRRRWRRRWPPSSYETVTGHPELRRADQERGTHGRDIPRFISVDDHVVEPPHLFQRGCRRSGPTTRARRASSAGGIGKLEYKGGTTLRDRVGRHASRSPTPGSTRSSSRRTSATSRRSGSRATR